MNGAPRIVQLSESALTIEFGDTIDARTNELVLAFVAAIEHTAIEGLVEVVPTYRSATIYFNPLLTDTATITEQV